MDEFDKPKSKAHSIRMQRLKNILTQYIESSDSIEQVIQQFEKSMDIKKDRYQIYTRSYYDDHKSELNAKRLDALRVQRTNKKQLTNT